MTASIFHSSLFAGARLRHAFAPRKPRHRLLKLVVGVAGLAVVLALVFMGVFVGLAMLTVGIVLRMLRQRGKPIASGARDARVLDGNFRVVARPALPRA